MARQTIFVKDFYFNAVDDTFVKKVEEIPLEFRKVLTTYKYRTPEFIPEGIKFEKNDPPLSFRLSPESLLNMTIKLCENVKLPNVYTWDIEKVCRWLRRYGFPQYQNAFRVNLINGRTLLLLDASALSAMNIKDFDHIRKITYGIRCLFYFEMTKFGRSISLAPEYHVELYKLLRVKTGTKYEKSKASDLWRRMQLIRPRCGYREHWEILEKWLQFEPTQIERIGGIHRYDLFKCNKKLEEVYTEEEEEEGKPCNCMPPCECYWSEREIREPWKLSTVPEEVFQTHPREKIILSVLQRAFPDRYFDQSIQYRHYHMFKKESEDSFW